MKKKQEQVQKKKGGMPLGYKSAMTKRVISTIEKLHKTVGLTTEALIEEAKDSKSPLHHLFEWDNSKAAEQWRLQQARIIINQVKVIINEREYSKWESVNVHVIDDDGNIKNRRVYKPIEEIISTPELRDQLIANSLRQLQYWEEQNEKYQELRPIISTAQSVRRRLQKKWQKKKQ